MTIDMDLDLNCQVTQIGSTFCGLDPEFLGLLNRP